MQSRYKNKEIKVNFSSLILIWQNLEDDISKRFVYMVCSRPWLKRR